MEAINNIDRECCFYCECTENLELCKFCSNVYYCTDKNHFRHHRMALLEDKSKEICLPFKVTKAEDCPDKGRIVVAARDIKPFEMIVENRAASYGPFSVCNRVCLGCPKTVEEGLDCPKCLLPLHKECREAKVHIPECLAFSKLGRPPPDLVGIYSLVLPIRLLYLREADPDMWSQVLALESHEERRDELGGQYKGLLRECGFSEDDIKLLNRLVGIISTNSACYGKVRGMAKGHGLFPQFSMICHSCASNCRFAAFEVDGGDAVYIQVRAKTAIKKGEEVSIQYKNPLLGNAVRHKALESNWKFACGCKRCKDPTEFGTFLSAVRCTSTEDPECYENGGFMLMDEVENNKRIWRCEKCKYVEEDDLITQLTDDMNSKVKGTSCMADPQVWEELLSEGLKTFHSNHHLNMDAKRVLIQLYGSLPGFRLNELSDDLLQRKFDFCKEYIELYAKVDPGYTTWKGRLLEEMSSPSALLAKRKMIRGEISKLQFDLECLKSMKMLKDAVKCRQFETEESVHLGKVFAYLLKEFNECLDEADSAACAVVANQRQNGELDSEKS